MTEQPQSSDPATKIQQPPPAAQQSGTRPPDPPSWSPPQDGGPAALVEERPEIAVGAAFAGGFVLAMILKRLAR